MDQFDLNSHIVPSVLGGGGHSRLWFSIACLLVVVLIYTNGYLPKLIGADNASTVTSKVNSSESWLCKKIGLFCT
jgi:hypothetical protein